jgi:hypothetical protein
MAKVTEDQLMLWDKISISDMPTRALLVLKMK